MIMFLPTRKQKATPHPGNSHSSPSFHLIPVSLSRHVPGWSGGTKVRFIQYLLVCNCHSSFTLMHLTYAITDYITWKPNHFYMDITHLSYHHLSLSHPITQNTIQVFNFKSVNCHYFFTSFLHWYLLDWDSLSNAVLIFLLPCKILFLTSSSCSYP